MLTPPSKGTPIDLEFIGLLTKEVNTIQNKLNGDSVSTSSLAGVVSESFGRIAFYTGSVPVPPQSVDTNLIVPVTFEFGNTFSTAPIVTTSITNAGSTQEGNYVNATVANVNSNGCRLNLTYGRSATNINVTVNVIAIGLSR